MQRRKEHQKLLKGFKTNLFLFSFASFLLFFLASLRYAFKLKCFNLTIVAQAKNQRKPAELVP